VPGAESWAGDTDDGITLLQGTCPRRGSATSSAARSSKQREAERREQVDSAAARAALLITRDEARILYQQAQARRGFQKITKLAGLGEDWSPRELRHSFVSILSAHDVPVEDISDLVGHVSTHVTETVYRHEIRPALTKGAQAMDKILKRRSQSA
jgi:integrase